MLFFEAGSRYVAQVGLELEILLSSPSKVGAFYDEKEL
jgi:hypothetical protein